MSQDKGLDNSTTLPVVSPKTPRPQPVALVLCGPAYRQSWLALDGTRREGWIPSRGLHGTSRACLQLCLVVEGLDLVLSAGRLLRLGAGLRANARLVVRSECRARRILRLPLFRRHVRQLLLLHLRPHRRTFNRLPAPPYPISISDPWWLLVGFASCHQQLSACAAARRGSIPQLTGADRCGTPRGICCPCDQSEGALYLLEMETSKRICCHSCSPGSGGFLLQRLLQHLVAHSRYGCSIGWRTTATINPTACQLQDWLYTGARRPVDLSLTISLCGKLCSLLAFQSSRSAALNWKSSSLLMSRAEPGNKLLVGQIVRPAIHSMAP